MKPDFEDFVTFLCRCYSTKYYFSVCFFLDFPAFCRIMHFDWIFSVFSLYFIKCLSCNSLEKCRLRLLHESTQVLGPLQPDGSLFSIGQGNTFGPNRPWKIWCHHCPRACFQPAFKCPLWYTQARVVTQHQGTFLAADWWNLTPLERCQPVLLRHCLLSELFTIVFPLQLSSPLKQTLISLMDA